MTNFFKKYYFYPIILAIYPPLAIYSFNNQYVHFSETYRVLGITLSLSIILFFILDWRIKDYKISALIESYFILLFFSYGHVFNFIEKINTNFGRNLYVTIFWIGLLFLGIRKILKKQINQHSATQFLQFTSVILLILIIFQIGNYEYIKYYSNKNTILNNKNSTIDTTSINEGVLPDIYYIILDGHTRSDILLEYFDYDNSEFIGELTELGFFVGECSQSNYWHTALSLTSSLNINYLETFLQDPNLQPDWKYSLVKETLDSHGYKTIIFETRAMHDQDIGEDFLLERRPTVIYEKFYTFSQLNDYEAMFINTTWLQSWLQLLANYVEFLPQELILDPDNAAYLEHYRQTNFILDELINVPYLETDGPKFVFAHILSPHEPFIFSPEGKYEYSHGYEEFTSGYRNNVIYLNSVLGKIAKNIIARSKIDPIIIIQGDHGPNGHPKNQLLPILNAYYFPNGGDHFLYDNITPVNSFRILFNQYFGMDYELLDDVSYYSNDLVYDNPEIILNTCGNKNP